MSILHSEIRDFIQAHYRTSNRTEPYWQSAQYDLPLSDYLADKFEQWRYRLPDPSDSRDGTLFKYWNYIFCLHPKGFFDDVEYPVNGSLNLDDWQRFEREVEMQREKLLNHLPSHNSLLENVRSGRSLMMGRQAQPSGVNMPFAARPVLRS
jgi:hypothetical protein